MGVLIPNPPYGKNAPVSSSSSREVKNTACYEPLALRRLTNLVPGELPRTGARSSTKYFAFSSPLFPY